nr:hypothetical protein CFP56_29670 [Quercus suber]
MPTHNKPTLIQQQTQNSHIDCSLLSHSLSVSAASIFAAYQRHHQVKRSEVADTQWLTPLKDCSFPVTYQWHNSS